MHGRVLSFHYVLTNNNGEVLDSSRDTEPFQAMEGKQQIIPGLEEEIFKLNPGDKKKIRVVADKAYGPVNEKLRMKVSRGELPQGEIGVGAQFSAGEGEHGIIFSVMKIEGEDVYLDGNHPLAGVDLTFDVEVIALREATAEELQHGHAHGGEGHHH